MRNLSKRENEVLESIAFGSSIKEVSSRLFIAERTVVTHIQNIYDKVGLRSLNSITAWYFCTRFNLEMDGIPLKNKLYAICFFLVILPNTLSLEDKFTRTRQVGRRNVKREYAIIN